MSKEIAKLSLDCMAVEIHNKCNPSIDNAKVHIHYYGGDSVSIVTSGLPNKPCEIVIDIEKIKQSLDFFNNLIFNDLRVDNLQKRVNKLELEKIKLKEWADRGKQLEQENILLRTELHGKK